MLIYDDELTSCCDDQIMHMLLLQVNFKMIIHSINKLEKICT